MHSRRQAELRERSQAMSGDRMAPGKRNAAENRLENRSHSETELDIRPNLLFLRPEFDFNRIQNRIGIIQSSYGSVFTANNLSHYRNQAALLIDGGIQEALGPDQETALLIGPRPEDDPRFPGEAAPQ